MRINIEFPKLLIPFHTGINNSLLVVVEYKSLLKALDITVLDPLNTGKRT